MDITITFMGLSKTLPLWAAVSYVAIIAMVVYLDVVLLQALGL